jgi:hypothetical protein
MKLESNKNKKINKTKLFCGNIFLKKKKINNFQTLSIFDFQIWKKQCFSYFFFFTTWTFRDKEIVFSSLSKKIKKSE